MLFSGAFSTIGEVMLNRHPSVDSILMGLFINPLDLAAWAQRQRHIIAVVEMIMPIAAPC